MVAFTAGSVLTAANLNSAFNALTIRTVTGTSDTLVLADAGGCVSYSNASAVSVTVPLFSSIAYATGTKIVLVNLGAGTVTIAGTGGVTVNGSPLTLAQNAGGTLLKTDTNTWSFLPFSSGVGAANFSDTATGSYTGYKYKTFLASGTLTVTTAGFADIVVCGGGGGGNTASYGGGGAGGVLQVTNAYLPAGTLTVTVGGGSPTNPLQGSGTPSAIGSYFSPGGGNGAGAATLPGGSGGSGGGGGYGSSGAGGTGIAGIGNNGGSASAGTSPGGGGGGGGAGAVGASTTTGVGGAGGAGTTISLAGTTPSGAYVAGTYALGGGGGAFGDTSSGAGGSGGGGAGGATGTSGSANTGGGGGSKNSRGGSGIVIVRVAV